MASEQTNPRTRRLGRRAALRAGAAGLGLGLAAGSGLGVADAATSPWRTVHLEVAQTPMNPVSITAAGSGPPQRGDWFHIDAPIYAADDVGGAEIGRYQCFGAWTHAATETTAPDQRLTTVQFSFYGKGALMGLINEGGVDQPSLVGAIQGGTGAYTGALGTFTQAGLAAGTPEAPTRLVVRVTFELLLPNLDGLVPLVQVP